jgi:hypothetical protein
MFQRTLRRSNYIFNNTNLSFPSKAFPINRTNPCKDEPPKSLLYLKKDLKTIPIDPDWKIKELVQRSLEKEGVGGGGGGGRGGAGGIFRGLVGILFFILFLYERRII